jgi:hypothetical protein
MMMMTMRVPRPIVTLRFMVSPLQIWRFRNKGERAGVPLNATGLVIPANAGIQRGLDGLAAGGCAVTGFPLSRE